MWALGFDISLPKVLIYAFGISNLVTLKTIFKCTLYLVTEPFYNDIIYSPCNFQNKVILILANQKLNTPISAALPFPNLIIEF